MEIRSDDVYRKTWFKSTALALVHMALSLSMFYRGKHKEQRALFWLVIPRPVRDCQVICKFANIQPNRQCSQRCRQALYHLELMFDLEHHSIIANLYRVSDSRRDCPFSKLLIVFCPALQTAKRHRCPAPSCTKRFNRVQHLNRHIRNQKNDVHKRLARVIAARWCTPCNKGVARPVDLVKHENTRHGATHESRLDNFLIRAGLPSPPPQTSWRLTIYLAGEPDVNSVQCSH